MPPVRAASAAWLPCSTMRPRSNTRMRSRLRTVDSRCAITIEVRPFISRSIACWISASDSESRLEVASSRISTGPSARDAPAADIVEPLHQLDEGGLARAGPSDQANAFAGADVDGQPVIQRRGMAAIVERDLVEHDAAALDLDGHGVARIDDADRLVVDR